MSDRYPNIYAPTQTPTTVARQQRKAVQAERRAVTPPTAANTPGSGQVTNPSPILPLATGRPDFAGASQRQFRGQQPQSMPPASGATNYMGQPIGSAAAQPDVYAPPADWRGKQYVNNPPPGGNQRPDYAGPKLIPMNTQGAIAPRAQAGESDAKTPGRFDTALKRNLDLYATRYEQPPAEDNQPTPNRDELVASATPAAAADAASNEMTRIEQTYGDTATPHQEPGSAAYKPVQWSEAKDPNWRTSLRQKHAWVDDVKDPRQAQFVAAMRQSKDPNQAIAVADSIAAQTASATPSSSPSRGGMMKAPSSSAPTPAAPPAQTSAAATPAPGAGKLEVYGPPMPPKAQAQTQYGPPASLAPDPYAETDKVRYVDSHDKNGKPIKVAVKKDPLPWVSKAIDFLNPIAPPKS